MAEGRAARVSALWRYPVKSMLGERLDEADLGGGGLVGDRAYALLDTRTGRIVSAKNPKRWPALFAFRSEYLRRPSPGAALPPARITFPDGTTTTTDAPDAEGLLSAALDAPIRITSAVAGPARVEEFSPDLRGGGAGTVAEFTARSGPFFDAHPVLVVTSGTLARLSASYPAGRFDPRRFRPNVLVESDEEAEGAWAAGRTIELGDGARLRVTKPCSRCVMTTLAQGDLPDDLGILRTVAGSSGGRVGVYAQVERGGRVRLGDPVLLR